MGLAEDLKAILLKLAYYLQGKTLRHTIYQLAGIEIGRNTYIARNVTIDFRVVIGNNVRILPFTTLGAHVKIGDNVEIRPRATIGDAVKIGNNVVIGENSRISNAIIGDNTFIEYGVIFTGSGPNKIIIRNDCYIGINSILNWDGGIEINDHVHISGPSVGLWTHSSVFDCLLGHSLYDHANRKVAGIKIDSNIWIGGNSTIYPGVTINNHSVILPNSAVHRSIPANSVVGGVPARKIKDTSAILIT